MVSIQPGNTVNVVTEFRYGPGGRLEALIAKNPETGDQVTRYEYGVTLLDSDGASNDLLRAEIYPDAADSSDRVTYRYNRQGQRIKMMAMMNHYAIVTVQITSITDLNHRKRIGCFTLGVQQSSVSLML